MVDPSRTDARLQIGDLIDLDFATQTKGVFWRCGAAGEREKKCVTHICLPISSPGKNGERENLWDQGEGKKTTILEKRSLNPFLLHKPTQSLFTYSSFEKKALTYSLHFLF